MEAEFFDVKIAQNPCWYCQMREEDLRCDINELICRQFLHGTNSFYLQVFLYPELECRCADVHCHPFARLRYWMRSPTAQKRCRTGFNSTTGIRTPHLRSI